MHNEQEFYSATQEAIAMLAKDFSLTKREEEVVNTMMVTNGRTLDVATVLHIHVKTLKNHIRNIFVKMDIASSKQIYTTVMQYLFVNLKSDTLT